MPALWLRDERAVYGPPSIARPLRGARRGGAGLGGAGLRGAALLGEALLGAIRPSVLHAITAERAPAYVAILAGLLSMRRDHELQPLVDDLEHLVTPASGGSADGSEAFARDLAQLAEWGCVEKQVEPLRIRGYRDARRERFRYRLSKDAVALLEWLEARGRERWDERRPDGRDILADVLGQARELGRVVARASEPGSPLASGPHSPLASGPHSPLASGPHSPLASGPDSGGAARRVMHLLSAIDDGVHAITEELIDFRARMLCFSGAAYDAGTLREILSWLERYVTVHLVAVHGLRADIEEQLGALSSELSLSALEACRETLENERAETPRAIRGAGALPDPGAQLMALLAFFSASGRLVTLCMHTDASARDVLRKLHGHLRELERRSARRDELGRAITALQASDVSADAALAWLFALLASAQVQTVPVGDDGRAPPPLPRRHVRSAGSREPPVLVAKAAPVAVARGSRQRRREALAAWLDEAVLTDPIAGTRNSARASELAAELLSRPPEPSSRLSSPRTWIDLARARHLGRGRELVALGVRVADADGLARLATEAWALESRDFVIERDRDGTGRKKR